MGAVAAAPIEMFPPQDVRDQLDRVAAVGLVHAVDQPLVVTYAVTTSGNPRVDPEDVAAVAADAYGSSRGWSLGGAIRFERVSSSDAADFTLVVAAPEVIADYSEACLNGMTGEPDASCTAGNNVLINETRWMDGALGDPFPLDAFRVQEINHETGHWLGQDHFTCGGIGEPAPVNQQQFRHLSGCLPNPWPLPWERALVGLRLGIWRAPDGMDAAGLLDAATPEAG